MTRFLAGYFGIALLRHAHSERYPTRTVEHLLAWLVLAWSLSVVSPGNMLVGPSFQPLLVLASEQVWGWGGMIISSLRLVGLYLNGNWRRSPWLRAAGALAGGMWWLTLFCLYWKAVGNGAPDFPMRLGFGVLVVFEAASFFRCVQDAVVPRKSGTNAIGAEGYG